MLKIKHGQIKCAFCKGTGVLQKETFFPIKCQVCWGKKFVNLDRAVDCVYCGAKGKQATNNSLPCQVCKGVGAVAIRGSFKICPECKGAGRMSGKFLPCITCKGKGILEKD